MKRDEKNLPMGACKAVRVLKNTCSFSTLMDVYFILNSSLQVPAPVQMTHHPALILNPKKGLGSKGLMTWTALILNSKKGLGSKGLMTWTSR